MRHQQEFQRFQMNCFYSVRDQFKGRESPFRIFKKKENQSKKTASDYKKDNR